MDGLWESPDNTILKDIVLEVPLRWDHSLIFFACMFLSGDSFLFLTVQSHLQVFEIVRRFKHMF